MGYVHGRSRARRRVAFARGRWVTPASARHASSSARRPARGRRKPRGGSLTPGRYELILAGIDPAALSAAFPEAAVSRDGGHCRLFAAFDDERLIAGLHRIALLGGRLLGILSADRLPVPGRR